MGIMKKFLAYLLIGFSTCSFGLTKISLALDWYINPDHAPILAAQTQGYFKQHGLEVTLLEPSQNSEVRALVASGQATFGIDYEPETLIAISNGFPIAIVGNLVPVPLGCLTVLQSSGITSLAQLKGKTVGYSGDPSEKATLEIEFAHAGLNNNDVKLLPIQMDLTQALLSHTVDGVNGMMRNVEPVMLKMRGIQTYLFYPEQNGIPLYSELVFISNKNVDPKVSAAFLSAVGEGAAYVKAHPQASWQAAVKAYPSQLASSPEISKENANIWQVSIPYFTAHPGTLNQKQINHFQAFLIKAGVIAK